jgi:hypothetical protein
MNFKDFFVKKVISEVSSDVIDKLPHDVQELLRKKALPFDHIFGDKLRIAERMNQISNYEKQIRDSLVEGDYDLDFEKWAGFKPKDVDKKNPIRIGKILNKRKQEIQKAIKTTEENIKNNPTHTIPPVELKVWNDSLAKIDELLKVTDLQKMYNDSKKSNFIIIYSRAPVDVVRMSDHTWTSCHSEGGEFFYCALADAQRNAGIAYLVNEAEYEQIADRLQDDEIFADSDRAIEGIVPRGRIRIRALVDSKGSTLAVPSTRIYKKYNDTLTDDFAIHMKEWAKRQDISNFDFDGVLQLKGGEYEDHSYTVMIMVKEIWGKNISYSIDHTANDRFREEEEDDWGIQEEQWWDDVRGDFNADGIGAEAFGDDYEDWLTVGYDIDTGSVDLVYELNRNLCKNLQEKLGDNAVNKEIKFTYRGDPQIATINLAATEIQFHTPKTFHVHDYGEFYGPEQGGRFSDDQLTTDVADYVRAIITSFIQENIDWYEDTTFFDLQQIVTQMVYEAYGLSFDVMDIGDINDFYDKFVSKRGNVFGTEVTRVSVKEFPYSFNQNNPYNKQVILKSEVFDELWDTSANIEDGLFYILTNKFGVSEKVASYTIHGKFALDSYSYAHNVADPKTNRHRQLHFTKVDGITEPTYLVQLWIEKEELSEIIDTGELSKLYKGLLYLSEDLYDDHLVNVENFYELEKVLKSLVPSVAYRELKNQGQMELDLSQTIKLSINKSMSLFNETYEKILQEVNSITGKQEAPAVNPNMAPTQQGTTPVASNTPNATRTPQNPAMKANMQATPQQGASPDETAEFDELMQLQQSNPEVFNTQIADLASKDINKFSRLISRFSQPTVQA